MTRFLVLLAALCLVVCNGAIYKYNDEVPPADYELVDTYETMERSGMYSPQDAPSHGKPGNGESYLSIQVSVSGVDKREGILEILSFSYADSALIGYTDPKDSRTYLCCNDERKQKVKGGCDIGRVIAPKNYGTIRVWTVNLTDTSFVDVKEMIAATGMYYFYFINCQQQQGSATALVQGTVTFMNPFGYLPGQLYNFMPFYAVLSVVYLIMLIVWLVLMCCHRSQLLPLQKAIAGVIFLGFLEQAINFFDYLGYDEQGDNYVAAMIFGTLASTLKRTISRVLILVVSLGYGVVKPTLGADRLRVLVLSVTYTIFAAIFNIENLVSRESESLDIWIVIFLVVPISIMDTTFYWWTFLSLLKTMNQLQIRKQVVKYAMYKSFFGVLVSAGLVSILIILVNIVVYFTSTAVETWQSDWFTQTGCWDLLYLVILLSMLILWRPTKNNTRYAYAEMIPDDVQHEISLPTFSEALGSNSPAQDRKPDNSNFSISDETETRQELSKLD